MTCFRHLVALLALGTGFHAWAAVPSDASLDELLTITRADRMSQEMIAHMEAALPQMLTQSAQAAGKPVTDDQRREMEEIGRRTAQVMREEMAWSRLRPIYLQIHRESFTQEEVDGMLAFYRSPAGAAVIEKMPVVMQKSMQLMEQLSAGMVQKLQARVAQALKEPGQGGGRKP